MQPGPTEAAVAHEALLLRFYALASLLSFSPHRYRRLVLERRIRNQATHAYGGGGGGGDTAAASPPPPSPTELIAPLVEAVVYPFISPPTAGQPSLLATLQRLSEPRAMGAAGTTAKPTTTTTTRTERTPMASTRAVPTTATPTTTSPARGVVLGVTSTAPVPPGLHSPGLLPRGGGTGGGRVLARGTTVAAGEVVGGVASTRGTLRTGTSPATPPWLTEERPTRGREGLPLFSPLISCGDDARGWRGYTDAHPCYAGVSAEQLTAELAEPQFERYHRHVRGKGHGVGERSASAPRAATAEALHRSGGGGSWVETSTGRYVSAAGVPLYVRIDDLASFHEDHWRLLPPALHTSAGIARVAALCPLALPSVVEGLLGVTAAGTAGLERAGGGDLVGSVAAVAASALGAVHRSWQRERVGRVVDDGVVSLAAVDLLTVDGSGASSGGGGGQPDAKQQRQAPPPPSPPPQPLGESLQALRLPAVGVPPVSTPQDGSTSPAARRPAAPTSTSDTALAGEPYATARRAVVFVLEHYAPVLASQRRQLRRIRGQLRTTVEALLAMLGAEGCTGGDSCEVVAPVRHRGGADAAERYAQLRSRLRALAKELESTYLPLAHAIAQLRATAVCLLAGGEDHGWLTELAGALLHARVLPFLDDLHEDVNEGAEGAGEEGAARSPRWLAAQCQVMPELDKLLLLREQLCERVLPRLRIDGVDECTHEQQQQQQQQQQGAGDVSLGRHSTADTHTTDTHTAADGETRELRTLAALLRACDGDASRLGADPAACAEVSPAITTAHVHASEQRASALLAMELHAQGVARDPAAWSPATALVFCLVTALRTRPRGATRAGAGGTSQTPTRSPAAAAATAIYGMASSTEATPTLSPALPPADVRGVLGSSPVSTPAWTARGVSPPPASVPLVWRLPERLPARVMSWHRDVLAAMTLTLPTRSRTSPVTAAALAQWFLHILLSHLGEGGEAVPPAAHPAHASAAETTAAAPSCAGRLPTGGLLSPCLALVHMMQGYPQCVAHVVLGGPALALLGNVTAALGAMPPPTVWLGAEGATRDGGDPSPPSGREGSLGNLEDRDTAPARVARESVRWEAAGPPALTEREGAGLTGEWAGAPGSVGGVTDALVCLSSLLALRLLQQLTVALSTTAGVAYVTAGVQLSTPPPPHSRDTAALTLLHEAHAAVHLLLQSLLTHPRRARLSAAAQSGLATLLLTWVHLLLRTGTTASAEGASVAAPPAPAPPLLISHEARALLLSGCHWVLLAVDHVLHCYEGGSPAHLCAALAHLAPGPAPAPASAAAEIDTTPRSPAVVEAIGRALVSVPTADAPAVAREYLLPALETVAAAAAVARFLADPTSTSPPPCLTPHVSAFYAFHESTTNTNAAAAAVVVPDRVGLWDLSEISDVDVGVGSPCATLTTSRGEGERGMPTARPTWTSTGATEEDSVGLGELKRHLASVVLSAENGSLVGVLPAAGQPCTLAARAALTGPTETCAPPGSTEELEGVWPHQRRWWAARVLGALDRSWWQARAATVVVGARSAHTRVGAAIAHARRQRWEKGGGGTNPSACAPLTAEEYMDVVEALEGGESTGQPEGSAAVCTSGFDGGDGGAGVDVGGDWLLDGCLSHRCLA